MRSLKIRKGLDHLPKFELIKCVNETEGGGEEDSVLSAVADAFLGSDQGVTESAIAGVLRDTIDQLLDGQHTGRYRWEQLYKTEKTHAGTLVEINLQRALKLQDGDVLDFKIAGAEVDCKYSQTLHGWMFPPEAVGHLCLVVWANDASGLWSLGLVRAQDRILSVGQNRDAKRHLTKEGQPHVRWLFRDRALPPNVYLALREAQVLDILGQASGQKRVNRLFVHAQGRIVGRGAVATAAQQDDFMKRVRENGGARSWLRPLGIAVFGHEHETLVRGLNLPIPRKGEFVSSALVPSTKSEHGAVLLGVGWWRRAKEGEPVTQPAPILPRSGDTETPS